MAHLGRVKFDWAHSTSNINVCISKIKGKLSGSIEPKLKSVIVDSVHNVMDHNYYKDIWLTGDTWRTVEAKSVNKTNQWAVSVEVGTGTWYTMYVHQGTTRMPGRPFLVDGVNAAADDIESIVQKDLSTL